MYDAIKKIPFEYLYQACLEKGVPIGKIRNIKEVFELPEAQAMVKQFPFGKQNIKAVSAIAFKFHDDKA